MKIKEKQLNAIKNINTDSKSLKAISFYSGLSPEAKKLLDELIKERNTIDPEKFVCVKTDGTIFNFNTVTYSLEFASNIYNDKTSLEDAKKSQYKMVSLLNELRNYKPTNPNKITAKKITLINAKKLYNNRNNVIKAFENRVFPFKDGFQKKESIMSNKVLPDWVKK